MAIAERKMKLDMDVYEVLRILSISLFERMPLGDLLRYEEPEPNLQSERQLSLNLF